MSKKMKLIPFLSKPKDTNHKQWQWPSCKQYPKTLSFRSGGEDVFKTVNSIFVHDQPPNKNGETETTESWVMSSCNSTTTTTTTTTTTNEPCHHESFETVLTRGLRSERLFFETSGNNNVSSSIVNKKSLTTLPFKDERAATMVVDMESDDPYRDFKTSMEEMVECCEIKEWERLEKLLAWYLKANAKKNHVFIVSAFLDLLVGKASTDTTRISSSSSRYSTSYSSALSSFSSPLSSSRSPFCLSGEVDDDDCADQLLS